MASDRQQVVVIGAGVIGASVGFRLAQAGASVTILDAGRPGSGTSTVSFAMTNASRKTPREYFELNLAGMRAHAALRAEFGATPWWHGGGKVDWFLDDAGRADQQRTVERARGWGYQVEWLSPAQLGVLEPSIDLTAPADAPIAYYPEEGWLDSLPYTSAMLAAARQAGATVHAYTRVTSVHSAAARVTGVQSADGRTFAADVVVNCAGRWADDVARLSGLTLPLAPSVGMVVLTPPVAVDLSRILYPPGFHVRPDGAGRLMLGSDETDAWVTADTRPDPALPGAVELVRRAAQVLRGLDGTSPEAVRIGVRPMPADGLSTIGPLPGLAGYYVAVTHSGVTLAPALGRLVADEIALERRQAQLEPFRPSRLFSGAPRSAPTHQQPVQTTQRTV